MYHCVLLKLVLNSPKRLKRGSLWKYNSDHHIVSRGVYDFACSIQVFKSGFHGTLNIKPNLERRHSELMRDGGIAFHVQKSLRRTTMLFSYNHFITSGTYKKVLSRFCQFFYFAS